MVANNHSSWDQDGGRVAGGGQKAGRGERGEGVRLLGRQRCTERGREIARETEMYRERERDC